MIWQQGSHLYAQEQPELSSARQLDIHGQKRATECHCQVHGFFKYIIIIYMQHFGTTTAIKSGWQNLGSSGMGVQGHRENEEHGQEWLLMSLMLIGWEGKV